MNDWEIIFRDAVSGLAGVVVYDKKVPDSLGRYIVAKTMKLASGRVRTHRTYYSQRPAAMRYAHKFLQQRAEKFGTTYQPGDGNKTLAFKHVWREAK